MAATRNTTRAVRLIAALGAVMLVATGVGACQGSIPGDPSPRDSSVILARASDGSLFVIGSVCGDTLTAVELGEGTNMDPKRAEIRLLAPRGVSGWFQVNLDAPESGGYRLSEDSAEPAAQLTPPFYVRFRGDGLWGSNFFTRLPLPGTALVWPDTDGTRTMKEVPLEEVPSSLRMCPDVQRTFAPASSTPVATSSPSSAGG